MNGKWVDVVVDDRLPYEFGRLKYMRSSADNEFWSALLEKAYAKIFGSYEALEGGGPYEAFEDFTGGISELFDLKNAPKNLYEIIKAAAKRGSLMAVTVNPDPNIPEEITPQGLVQGHVYSITKVKTVEVEITSKMKFNVKLIRIRNPWVCLLYI